MLIQSTVRRALPLAIVLGVSLANHLSAQAARIPLDVTSGFVTNAAGVTTPFAGAIRLAPMIDVAGGTGRVGLSGGALYTGAEWRVAGGLRAGVRVAGALDAGLFAYGDVLIGNDVLPVSVGLVGELPVGISVRTGVWFTRDTRLKTNSVSLLLGTDLAFWAFHHGPPPPHRPGDTP